MNKDDGNWLVGVHPLDVAPTPQELANIAWALNRAGLRTPSLHLTAEDARAVALGLLIALRNGDPQRRWMAVWSQELGPNVDGDVDFLTTDDLPDQ